MSTASGEAKDAAQAERRRKFFDDLFAAVPSYPLTFEIARRAARVDGEARRQGVTIPFQDLVIGVTALEFDYAVATYNVRHFQMIPKPDRKATLKSVANHLSPSGGTAARKPSATTLTSRNAPRFSGDIDVFHDREERVACPPSAL